MTGCILLSLGEGGLALVANVAWAKNPSMYSVCYLLPALCEGPWRRPTCYMMPDMTGSIFDEILANQDAVAIGTLDGQQPCGVYNVEILGQLSQPIGARRVLALPARVDEAAVANLRAQGVRYVIMDDLHSAPEALTRAALRVYYPSGFIVLKLR